MSESNKHIMDDRTKKIFEACLWILLLFMSIGIVASFIWPAV